MDKKLKKVLKYLASKKSPKSITNKKSFPKYFDDEVKRQSVKWDKDGN